MVTAPSESTCRSAGPATWVVVGSKAALGALAPLIKARRELQPVLELPDGAEALLSNPAEVLPRNVEAVLMVGPLRVSPRRGLPGLFLVDADQRRVPIGWLPEVCSGLALYAQAAARVVSRISECASAAHAVPVEAQNVLPRDAGVPARGKSPVGQKVQHRDPTAGPGRVPVQAPRTDQPVVVLGQWEDRFVRVGLRTARWFEQHDPHWPVFHWTADRILRENMLRALADCGPALALYFGHGRPRGWAGYHGVRRDHFTAPWAEPMGGLLALCCENASRWRTDVSFAEALALRGVFAGALAAVTRTRHEHNRRLGPLFCEALTGTAVRTLRDLVLALPPEEWINTPYRFIGDPAAPLLGARGGAERAAGVFAPAPDASLPPWQELSA